MWMDVDAALAAVPINILALTDDTDFKTREESVVYNQSGLDLLWNFVTTAGAYTQTAVTPTDTAGDYDWINKGNGMYSIEIPASAGASINNDTEGFGFFSGFATGILPWSGPVIGFRAAGLNNLMIDDAFSATRGLSGTALPAAVADAAGGLVISDAGGLDIDTLLGTLTSLAAETRDANVLDQFKRTLAVIEHFRGTHTHQPIGGIFFVSPNDGDTHANGNRGGITDPYKTIQDCHDNAVTDSNHDTIILLSDASAGATTHTGTGTTTLSKRYLFIRGPGRDFICIPSTNVDTFTITADGVELSGFRVDTTGAGSGKGIVVTSADLFLAEHLWVGNTRGNGIQLTNVDNAQIRCNHFHDTGQSGSGHGLVLDAGNGQSGDNVIVEDNHFHMIAGDAIRLNPTGSGTVNDAVIRRNHIASPTGDGVDITGSGANRTVIYENVISGAGGLSVNDNGTGTIDENNQQWAKHSIATEVRLSELDAGTGGKMASEVDLIVADTNEIQADQVDGGRLDLIWDAIKAITDQFVFTKANEVDSNMLSVAGTVQTAGDLVALLNAIDDFIDTEIADIQNRLPAALTGAGNMKSDMLAINGSTAAAVRLALASAGMVTGTVHNAVAPTTEIFECDDITTAAADHYNGKLALFTSGTLLAQITDVLDYRLLAGRGEFTVTALTSAPANDVTVLFL